MPRIINVRINGIDRRAEIRDNEILLDVLRDRFTAKTVKASCWRGECGLCTVLLDKKPVKSCLILAADVDGSEIVTAEGLTDGETLNPIQKAFVEHGAMQCGFCTPAFVLVAHYLLSVNPSPTEEEVKEYLSGHICRCGAYKQIIEAIMKLAEEKKEAVPIVARTPAKKRAKRVK